MSRKKVILIWIIWISPFFGFITLMYLVKSNTINEFSRHDKKDSDFNMIYFSDLENPVNNLATVVYSSDGFILGEYFKENRHDVHYTELAPVLIDALISTEDIRFKKHPGIDARSLFRAAYGALLGNSSSGGASTITQQLSKMLFIQNPSSGIDRVKQKLKEQILAVELEKRYSKNEIIEMYLNRFDWINQGVGIFSASKTYFNIEPNELTINQAAMLVGMLKNPSLYNPKRNPEGTQNRRNVVLSQMMKNNKISKIEFDSLKTLPLELDFQKTGHNEGPTPYFREQIRKMLEEWCSDNNYNLYTDGLKVYTTIDSRIQKHAEQAVKDHLTVLQKEFYEAYKGKTTPYPRDFDKQEIEDLIHQSVKRSERYEKTEQAFDDTLLVTCTSCGSITKASISNKIGVYWSNKSSFNIPDILQGRGVCHICENIIDYNDILHIPDPLQYDRQKHELIEEVFNQKERMTLFSWKGEIDTLISPRDSVIYNKFFLHTGVMSMDPNTGHVKAYVGGINHKHFQYDHVLQGRRQVGSTFKPFLYSLAIQEGMLPCDKIFNSPVIFNNDDDKWGLTKDWIPKNASSQFDELQLSLKFGLANSINIMTASIMYKYGPQAVINISRKMGVTSPLPNSPSLCLGTADMSVKEITAAYSTFVNKGNYIEPLFITKITDKNGVILEEFLAKTNEALNEKTAAIMVELLKGVVKGVRSEEKYSSGETIGTRGTGMSLKGSKYNINAEIGGKTGTTQNYSDGWFVGITPNLVTAAWVGCEDRSAHFNNRKGYGSHMALPIFGKFIRSVYDDETITEVTEQDKFKYDKDTRKYIEKKMNCNKNIDIIFDEDENEDF